MDTQNSGFLFVQKFPIDILAGIMFFVPGEDIGRLKMTGCKSLWSILTCTNVVKTVKLGEGGIRFKSWPSFVKELPSLESLRIENEYQLWWSDLSLTIDQLPSTIRNLSLLSFEGQHSCDWSWDSFFEIPTRSDTIHLDEHLPHLEVLEMLGKEATNFDWVYRCPPSLTRLSVHHWNPEIALPSSIIHFQTVEGMPIVFPSAIESLSCLREEYSHSLPSLTSLSARLGKGELVQPEDIVSLPSSLTNLTIRYPTLPSVVWPLLATNLQSLSFDVTGADCTVTVRMVDPISGELRRVKTLPLELLPKSLTKLHINSYPIFVSGCCSSLFPPRLTSLDIPFLKLAPNAAKQLPSSLTHLSTFQLYEQLSEHLPRGLTSLFFFNALLSPKTISCLPKSLTKLDGHFSSSGSDQEESFDYTTGSRILSSSLPEYSVHKDYASYFSSLPPNLTSVQLNSFMELQDDFIQQQNFSNLLSLTLWDVDKISDHSIPLLNRHLTHLYVSQSPNITGKCFKSLPTSLTCLGLVSSSVIFDDDIQHLPRTLKEIHISSATELSDASVRDFPRGCTDLDITSNSKITQLCIPDLPPSMRSFFLENWSWSYEDISLDA